MRLVHVEPSQSLSSRDESCGLVDCSKEGIVLISQRFVFGNLEISVGFLSWDLAGWIVERTQVGKAVPRPPRLVLVVGSTPSHQTMAIQMERVEDSSVPGLEQVLTLPSM